ncbi:AraC family transcriptional regulator [Polyangium sp. y55x31]|uniref:AraC family transcriptional regulator n=1 Tax=Polyangium sp. y55x31 TaxID=3042688 RepID=UPI002482CE89|nr:AraC family transcriptional regulator [Polyangium sp. y55x31]
MNPPSMVHSQLALKVAGAAALLGADLESLLSTVGLAPDVLHDPEGRVPLATVLVLFEEAARITGEPAFGLRVAEIARGRPDNVLALAMQSDLTLGEAYRRASRYMRLVNDTLEIRVEIEGAACRLRHHQLLPDAASRHGVECSLAMLFLFGRQAIGPAFQVQRVCFRRAPPGNADEHARFFEAAVEFGQPYDALVFDKGLLDTALPTRSERISRHLDRLLEEMVLSLPRRGDLADRVRAALAAELGGGPTLERVATRLKMTPRSLQRRLQSEGVSFQGLLDELRHEMALRYLDQPDLGLAEVAFLLGFAEQSAFQRAFRRWQSTTPAVWRRQRRPPQGPHR